MNIFIFDVDGTLTPSRQIMDPGFEAFFIDFALRNPCYLVTGSDYPKTLEQVGERVMSVVKRVYNCSGCEVRENGKIVRTRDWEPEHDIIEWLEKEVTKSKFKTKTGLHTEIRQGMLNFSIVGRNCSLEERSMYREWDEQKHERRDIANRFKRRFKNIIANVAGETGIDIHPKGWDKSQILLDFDSNDTIYFFGDKMSKGGNDFPLAEANEGVNIDVQNWNQTYDKLQLINVTGISKK